MANQTRSTVIDNDPKSIQQNLGSLLLEIVFGSVLFGVVLLEGYRYFQRYKSDPFYLKISVLVLCGLDASMFAFSIHMAYYYLVQSFGDVQAVAKLVWSAKALDTAQVVLVCLVQCLYLIRTWSFTRRTFLIHKRHLILPVLCTVIALGVLILGTSLACMIDMNRADADNQDKVFSKWVLHLGYVVYLGYGVSAAIDVIITVALVSILIRYSTGMERTENVASRLIQYILSTGTLTSLTAIVYIVIKHLV